MRKTVFVLAALVGTAAAKPLPKGMKVTVAKGVIQVTQNGATAPMTDNGAGWSKLKSAVVNDTGVDIIVTATRCDEATETTLAGDEVAARIENVLGMKAHLKKKYADAIPHFAAAAAKDTWHVMFATNLLSAQAMGGLLDDADKTLATYGSKNTAYFAWRLAADPELKALDGRPSVAAMLGKVKPGVVKVRDLQDDDKYTLSPLGYAAAVVNTGSNGDMSPYDTELSVVEIAQRREVVRLPLKHVCVATSDTEADLALLAKCQATADAKATAKYAAADKFLATMGFEKAIGFNTLGNEGEVTKSPDGKQSWNWEAAELTAAGKTAAADDRVFAMDWLPKNGVLLVQRRTTDCGEAFQTYLQTLFP